MYCNCCHIRVTVTNHSSCHDTEQMKISYQTREEEEEDITPALRVSQSACSSSFSSCLLFLILFSCCCCCFVFVAVAVLNLRKMAQRNKLKCSKSRRRRCRASFHSATSYHTTTQHRGQLGEGGIVAACHGMTATITKSHCYRRRNNKRATKTWRNIKSSTTNIECAARKKGYLL